MYKSLFMFGVIPAMHLYEIVTRKHRRWLREIVISVEWWTWDMIVFFFFCFRADTPQTGRNEILVLFLLLLHNIHVVSRSRSVDCHQFRYMKSSSQSALRSWLLLPSMLSSVKRSSYAWSFWYFFSFHSCACRSSSFFCYKRVSNHSTSPQGRHDSGFL